MIVRNHQDVGALIRERRRELGLDQQHLADQVGVSRLWVSEIERGKPRAELALVLRTLSVLGLELEASLAPEQAGTRIERVLERARGRRK